MSRSSSVHNRVASVRQTYRRIKWYPAIHKTVPIIAYSLWVVTSFFMGAIVAIVLLRSLIAIGVPYLALADALQVVIYTALSFFLTLLIAVGIPVKLLKQRIVTSQLGIDKLLTWYDLVAGVLGFVPYFLIAYFALAIAQIIIPGFNIAQAQDVGFAGIHTASEYILAFLTLVVIAPIAEELLFRGYFYGVLRKYVGFIVASIVVSVVFGALHGQWNVGVNVFALSLVLCGLREMTGSIWAGIVLHMCKNAIAFYGLFMMHL